MRRPRLIGIKPKSKDTHVAIAINPDKTGVILKVDSNVFKGRGTTLKLGLKKFANERAIKDTLMFGAAQLAERQNEIYRDNHDIREVALKAAEAWDMLIKDNVLLAELGTLVPFSPHSPDGGDVAPKRVSRASLDDPLTKDLMRGKGKFWGVEN